MVVVVVWVGGVSEEVEGLVGEEGEDGAQISVVIMSEQISSAVGEEEGGPGGGVEAEEEGWWERISSRRCERTCFAPRMRSVSRSWRWV